jgi:hypothetical protein
VDTQFVTHKVAQKYEHTVMFTPPYHPEFQPIEKVWAIVKQPVAFDPDLEETCTKLQRKLLTALKEVTNSQLISVWKMSLNEVMEAQRLLQKQRRALKGITNTNTSS